MKRIILIWIVSMAFGVTTYAQLQAYESKIEYQKTMQQVVSIDVPYKTDVVEDAINDYMKKKGFKASSSKGFTVFRGVKLDEADTALSDIYIRIEKKKKDKDYSVVTVLPAKAGMDILSRPATDSTGQVDKTKNLLNQLTPYIEEHNTDVEISKQNEVLKKAQKKLNGLISDSTDLEKKLRNLHADEEQNKNDISKETHEMDNSLNATDDVRAKEHKKMNKLLDEQASISKKLRKTQEEFQETKESLTSQYKEVDKQQQVLDAIKAKKKMN